MVSTTTFALCVDTAGTFTDSLPLFGALESLHTSQFGF